MVKNLIKLLLVLITFSSPLKADTNLLAEITSTNDEEKFEVNFKDVTMLEFLRFVSTVTKTSFIYDEKILDFRISFVTGKPTSSQKILEIMTKLLNQQGIKAYKNDGYYLVEKMDPWEVQHHQKLKLSELKTSYKRNELIMPVSKYQSESSSQSVGIGRKDDFSIYKLQYHVGTEILSAIKNISLTLKNNDESEAEIINSINSMQYVESTNSILYSGSKSGMDELTSLIQSLDVPKKQVFIEVLVIETDVKKGLEFGLEWAAGGTYKDKLGFGSGNFPATRTQTPFADTFKSINATTTPTGTQQFPIGRGFDLGVIGDIIMHKGKSYFSLGSLVSALQADGESTIVLNQKIITQDNKLSKIFVGDNIAFTGSTVETIGASQQTSSNIEYRDVGVKLNITPLLGNGDVITLEVLEEITDIIPNLNHIGSTSNGINTTKTDMATQVHVPDQSFLVLSGMIRNTKRQHKSGVPCLGGLPLIGSVFSKSTQEEEKRNIIVFVRPQIIHTKSDIDDITAFQKKQFDDASDNPQAYTNEISMLQNKR